MSEKMEMELNDMSMWLPALRMFAWKMRAILLFPAELEALNNDPAMEGINRWSDCPLTVRDNLMSRAEKWMEKNRTPHYDDMDGIYRTTWAQDMFNEELRRKERRENRA